MFVVVVVVVITVVVDFCCKLVMAGLIIWNAPFLCIFVDVRVGVRGSVDVGASMGFHYPSPRLGRIKTGWERPAR